MYIHLLNACWDGVHPSENHRGEAWAEGTPQSMLAGTPLCGGQVKIIIWVYTGDLDFFAGVPPLQ